MSDQKNNKLSKEQKEAVGLLSIGTFLEYFDLMLYTHMAVVLNELFFPKSDPHSAAIFAAVAFCSTYVFRPFGALLFGYIGDNIGRKHTVVITTLLMALSCVIMANLPTYEQIGIGASWVITICRIVQGISSTGEITGAQIYLTEITKPPVQYPAVAYVYFFALVGSVVALSVATFATNYSFNWRIAFWVGAGVALVGAYSRRTLRETPDFANAQNRLKKYSEQLGKDDKYLENISIFKEKVKPQTSLAFFIMSIGGPVSFYLTYIHYGALLKTNFGYSAAQVISHNLMVGLICMIGCAIELLLTYRFNPIQIIKVRSYIFIVFLLFFPILFDAIKTPFHLFLFQCFIIVFGLEAYPAKSIFFKHFPVLKRFTYSCVLHAISHACTYVIISFGFIFLVKWFGQMGVLFLLAPVCLGVGLSMRYFEKLEQEYSGSCHLEEDQKLNNYVPAS